MRRRLRTSVPALISLGSLLAYSVLAVPAADRDEGEVKFNNHCRTCHSTQKDDNRLGPSLHGIFGAKAGTVPGYANYSQGLKTSGIVWDEASLDRFIANPDTVIPSNNMKPYKGVTDAAVRKQIVGFLESKSTAQPQPEKQ
jgi:cytochrome c